jgi:hypothetical protein
MSRNGGGGTNTQRVPVQHHLSTGAFGADVAGSFQHLLRNGDNSILTPKYG